MEWDYKSFQMGVCLKMIRIKDMIQLSREGGKWWEKNIREGNKNPKLNVYILQYV